jgi:hypothetical protein
MNEDASSLRHLSLGRSLAHHILRPATCVVRTVRARLRPDATTVVGSIRRYARYRQELHGVHALRHCEVLTGLVGRAVRIRRPVTAVHASYVGRISIHLSRFANVVIMCACLSAALPKVAFIRLKKSWLALFWLSIRAAVENGVPIARCAESVAVEVKNWEFGGGFTTCLLSCVCKTHSNRRRPPPPPPRRLARQRDKAPARWWRGSSMPRENTTCA